MPFAILRVDGGRKNSAAGTGQDLVIHLYTDDQARPEARSRGDACVAPAHLFVKRNDRSLIVPFENYRYAHFSMSYDVVLAVGVTAAGPFHHVSHCPIVSE